MKNESIGYPELFQTNSWHTCKAEACLVNNLSYMYIFILPTPVTIYISTASITCNLKTVCEHNLYCFSSIFYEVSLLLFTFITLKNLNFMYNYILLQLNTTKKEYCKQI
jgi:hypothetical protein